MTCSRFQEFWPDMLLESERVSAHAPRSAGIPVEAQQHLASCASCQQHWRELQATMQLLDEWEAPEPSPYFDTRMAARLREEKSSRLPGWMEQFRTRVLFGNNLHLRPAIAGAFALLLMVGAGSYEGFVFLNRPQPARQTVSATVNDLELFDRNAQTLQQLTAFDDTDPAVHQGSGSATN